VKTKEIWAMEAIPSSEFKSEVAVENLRRHWLDGFEFARDLIARRAAYDGILMHEKDQKGVIWIQFTGEGDDGVDFNP
jgi:hypothetical protein